MIVPAKYDLVVKKGEDFTFTFDIDIDGVTLNLANATVYSQVRDDSYRGANSIANFTVTVDGNSTPTATVSNNEINLALTDTVTANITQTKGWYDVLVVDSAGNDTYYLEGKVAFTDSITVKA